MNWTKLFPFQPFTANALAVLGANRDEERVVPTGVREFAHRHAVYPMYGSGQIRAAVWTSVFELLCGRVHPLGEQHQHRVADPLRTPPTIQNPDYFTVGDSGCGTTGSNFPTEDPDHGLASLNHVVSPRRLPS